MDVLGSTQPIDNGSEDKVRLMPDSQRSKQKIISFHIGPSHYIGFVVESYLEHLPNLKYIVINNQAGEFLGLMSISHLNDKDSLSQFLNMLGDPDNFLEFYKDELVSDAVYIDSTTKRIFNIMYQREINVLPVVDDRKFIGVIEKSSFYESVLSTLIDKLNLKI